MVSFDELISQAGQNFEERLALLSSPELLKQSDKVERLKERARAIGIESELLEPRESVFSKVLNVIDKPKQVVQGVLDSAFIRQDIGDIGLLGAAERGLDERINAFDILRRETDLNPVARGVLGFGAEVLTDPLSFLSFGAGAAARGGGRGLSKIGREALEGTIEKPGVYKSVFDDAIAAGKDTIGALDDADKFAQKLGAFRDQRKALIEAGKTAPKEAQGAASLLDTAKLDGVGKLREELGKYLSPEQLDQVDDFFVKPKVNLGVTVPFAGHLDATDKVILNDLKKDKGLAQSIFGAIGGTINPKRYTKEFEIPEQIANNYTAYKNVFKEYTGKANKAVDDALAKAAEQTGLKIPAKLAQGAKGAVEGVGELFTKTFFGAGSKLDRHFREQLINKQAGARVQALGSLNEALVDVAQEFGPEDLKALPREELLAKGVGTKFALDEANKPFFEEAGRIIDDLGQNSLNNALEAYRVYDKNGKLVGLTDEGERLVNYFLEVRRNPNAPIPDIDFEAFDNNFLSGLRNLQEDANIKPQTKAIVRNFISAFDEQRAKELSRGVKSGFIEAYIPHRYTNLKELERTKSARKAGLSDFQKTRKFTNLDQALLEQGLVGNTNVAELFLERSMRGYQKIAEADYMQRMIIEHGLPAQTVRNLYKEALADPEGSAAQILKRNNLDTVGYLDSDQTAGVLKRAFARVGQKVDGGEKLSIQLFENPKIQKFLTDAQKELGDNNLTQSLLKSVQEGGDAIDNLVLDNRIPKLTFGEEPARLFKDADGHEYFLPTQVVNAIDEATQRKDIIKNILGDNELGNSFVEATDGILSAFKRLVTIPFPSYWSQNLLGDAFFRAADGGLLALSPDLTARTQGLLNGSHSVTLRSGITLDKKAFKELLERNGINLDIQDVIDINKSIGTWDLNKTAKRARGFKGNLKPGQVDLNAALDGAGDALRDKFENFFRAQHVLHHLERGSTGAEAATNAQRALINYRNLTDTERSVFRRFFFFYGWINGSTRNTLHNLVFNPGALQNQVKTARSIAEGFSEADAAPSIEEHDKRVLNSLTSQEQVSFSLGKDEEGRPLIGRGFGLPLNTLLSQFSVKAPRSLSVEEIIGAGFDSTTRTLQKQFAAANPIISGIAEVATGRNLYFDRPWDEQFLRKVPSMASIAERLGGHSFTSVPAQLIDDAFTREWLGGVPDGKGNLVVDPGKFWVLTHMIPGISRVISQGRGLSDTRLSNFEAALKSLSGVRIETADPGRNLLYEDERNIRSLLKRRSENLRKDERRRNILSGLGIPQG